ncbi:hypothetical protein D3C76_841490 [compost metagenome]
MFPQPALGGLQLACRIAPAQQAIEPHQGIVVAALDGAAHGLFGFLLGAQAAQLFGEGQHQLRLVALGAGKLLPGTGQGLQGRFAFVQAFLAGLMQAGAPGAQLQLGQSAFRQRLVLAQLRQQTDQGRPVATHFMQMQHLPQHLVVARVTLMHGLEGFQRGIRITTVQLQFGMGQGDGQLGLGLALQSTLQQLLGLFMLADLLCRTGGAQVVDQRLRVVLGGAFQVT